MITTISDPGLQQVIRNAQKAFTSGSTKTVLVNGSNTTVSYPFSSPTDWRDTWIYFLLTDRFNHPLNPPKAIWNQRYNFRQGGIFKGITNQLDYIADLGAGAIWISPILKNANPDWPYTYPGYSTQNFLSVDARFASDGQDSTAEKEFTELVEAAHARGLYVVLDIVINHTARVFDYVFDEHTVDTFSSEAILNGTLGDEPGIEWINGFGFPRTDWKNDIPQGTNLSPDDAIWPSDLQSKNFFRRRGNKLSDAALPGSFAKGDFGSMRQMVFEYVADPQEEPALRKQYGLYPLVSILVKTYSYLIARFDIDAFRIDTAKYVSPAMLQNFGNAIREFCFSIGKKNFFMFGEIYDDEKTINQFIGRNTPDIEGVGIDAALDFPLFYQLPDVIKGLSDVSHIREVFKLRKETEQSLLSSHGEAGKYFVTFLDNHDQNQRFNFPGMAREQVIAGIAVLFCLQGIPCLYYGTEQGLDGTRKEDGTPSPGAMESVREALWGKQPSAFDVNQYYYQQIKTLGWLRRSEFALQYGRLYFREISGNGRDFGHAFGKGSVLAFSRVLYNTEILIVVNTSTSQLFQGFVLVDADINTDLPDMKVVYSNRGTEGTGTVQLVQNANFYDSNTFRGMADTTALFVILQPMEVQILKLKES